jgi:hypothetical protein
MATTGVGKFSCDDCGKSYSWKPELAGRRVKCKCGQPLSVPKADPAAAAAVATAVEDVPPGFEDLYALGAGTPVEPVTPPAFARAATPCPSCGAGVAADAVLCVSCGHNLKTGKKVKTKSVAPSAGGGGGRVGAPALAGATAGSGGGGLGGYAMLAARRHGDPTATAAARGRDVFFHPVKDLYVPAGLIVAGLVLSWVVMVFHHGVGAGGAVAAVLVMSLINTVLTIPGILLTIRLFELGLGPIGPGVAKLAACAILPGAVGELLGMLLGSGAIGGYVGWFVSYLITVAIFMKLLEMDFFETMICSSIIFVVRTWLGYAILFAILRGFNVDLPGSDYTPGGARVTIAGHVEDDEDESLDAMRARQSDELTTGMLQRGGVEAKEWVEAHPNRRLAGQTRDKSVQLIRDFYAYGAGHVRVYPIGSPNKKDEVARRLIVVPPFPDDAAKKDVRARVFKQMNALAKQLGRVQAPRDRGEKYWLVDMLTDKQAANHPDLKGSDEDPGNDPADNDEPATAPKPGQAKPAADDEEMDDEGDDN